MTSSARSQQVVFGPARAADAPVIAALSRDLIETGLPWSWRSERVARELRSRDVVAVAARDNGRLVGFAVTRFFDDYAHMGLLAVDPRWRRRGVGTGMVRWIEETARVAGTFTLHLECRESSQTARRFYRALGFTELALLPRYYAGVEGAVRMYRDLRLA